jgi:MazG family protein
VPSGELADALARLDEITRRLRRECPWDREQDERSIVPHTVEEAYELADAANAGDDARMLDELGDVLFQVYFLSLLLEERGSGDLAAVAEHCRQKLIRRHPHVFGEREAGTAGEVVRNWTEIKREQERGGDVFGDIPQAMPSTILAKKVQRRAESAGLDAERHAGEALSDARRTCESFFAPGWGDEAAERVGELLYDAVAAARALGVDPELALREHANAVRRGAQAE